MRYFFAALVFVPAACSGVTEVQPLMPLPRLSADIGALLSGTQSCQTLKLTNVERSEDDQKILADGQSLACEISKFEQDTSSDKKGRRDGVIQALMFVSDTNCNAYINTLRDIDIGSSTVLGAGDQIANVAGAAATDAASSRLFSVFSAFLTGANNSIRSAAFQGQTTLVVLDQVKRDRATMSAGIRARLGSTYDSWRIGPALQDVLEYHNNCSVMAGLKGLERAAVRADETVASIKAAAEKAVVDALRAPDGTTPPNAQELKRKVGDAMDAAAAASAKQQK